MGASSLANIGKFKVSWTVIAREREKEREREREREIGRKTVPVHGP